jgi:4-amino-4-deoxy-L-arabinose transferase-like glycosyltransferase
MPSLSSRRVVWILLLAGLVLAFAGADAMSLKGCDEAFYAQIAREMVQTGDWITPRFDGAPNFEKPPMLFWMMASLFRAFGVSDFAARLPVMGLGVLAVVLTGILVGRRRSPATALLAGSVVATTGLFWQLSHQVMMDVPAVAFTLLVWLGLLEMGGDRRWAWLVGPGLGLVVLTKGALGALILVACLPFMLWRKGPWPWELWAGAGLGLLPGVAWYGRMTALWGKSFWQVHLAQQVVQRAHEGLFPTNPLGPAFYVIHGLYTLLPWSGLIPLGVWVGWHKARTRDPLVILTLGFGAVYLLAISLMTTKFDHYALPLVIPMAVLIADALTQPVPIPGAVRGIGATLYGLAGLAGTAGALWAGAFRLPPTDPAWPAIHPMTVAAVLGLAATWLVASVCLATRPIGHLLGALLAGGAGMAFCLAATFQHPWDADPGLRRLLTKVPTGSSLVFLSSIPVRDDFCTYAMLRFRASGPFQQRLTDEATASGARYWLTQWQEAAPGAVGLAEDGRWRLYRPR